MIVHEVSLQLEFKIEMSVKAKTCVNYSLKAYPHPEKELLPARQEFCKPLNYIPS